MTEGKPDPSSYRDPAGFIFVYNNLYYRQVNHCYEGNFRLLNESGLYKKLVGEKKLIPHKEMDPIDIKDPNAYKILLPDQLSFISYPYEWCFEQWKDAAILTLDILKTALHYGMVLKDATAFNIQFVSGSPVWIDTLSFEKYDETKPWIAYRQFTECFLAPLLLARYRSPDLLKIFSIYANGIPLNLLVKMLPFKSKLDPNVLMHIVLQNSVSGNKKHHQKKNAVFNRQKLFNITENLISFVKSLKLPANRTTWNNYYEETVLNQEYLNSKVNLVKSWTADLSISTILDWGTNTGLFAELVAAQGKTTIAVDADTDCINRLYQSCREKEITNLTPLCIDLTYPSPAIGWDNLERKSFLSRAQSDLCLVLALVHHLAIGKNLSFLQLANTFSQISPWLLIEFIPKNDPKVELLLQNREDIFHDYSESVFVRVFETIYSIEKKETVARSGRSLFLMKRRKNAFEN